ncbi:hypothetical protein [Pseudoclavibacter sp. JSM 162008]|uniref:hypothetical protein n=1 Tax=Pseudoclavibacter sp. JSM 162008 TaxID=3229855 RepID=UPI003523D0B2
MTPPFLRPRSTARIWLWTAVIVILISLVLAPVLTSTTCYDSLDPTSSHCESVQLGFAGNQTNGWVWLAAVAATAVTGWLLARRHKSRDPR